MMHIFQKIKAFFWIAGPLLIFFGLIRDVFGNMAFEKGFAEGHLLNPGMAQAQFTIFRIAVQLGLVTVDKPFTMIDHRVNAELVLLGFFLLVLAAIISLIERIRGQG